MSGQALTPEFQLFEPLERLRIFTPLGIRFWDAALDRQVREGLIVTARRPGGDQRAVRAYTTRSGIYAFHGLPGQRAAEYPSGDDAVDVSPPELAPFAIEVIDSRLRFIPTVFQVDVPFAGIYPTGDGGPSAPPGVYLFSAPTRPVPSHLAVLRAQLVERDADDTEQPAAFALVEVEVAGQPPAYGIADERGGVAVQFPYPRFSTTLAGDSPPANIDETPNQHWEVVVRVRFDPDAFAFPAGSDVPDLRTIFSQRPGRIWTGRGSLPGSLTAEHVTGLAFGRELVLRHLPGSTFVIRRAV